MLNMRERTNVLFKRFSRLSLLRLVWKAILGLLTLQILTAAVLLVIAALGKRRKNEMSFPHQPFEEVQVGENFLQLSALFAEDTAEKFELTMEQWKSRPWYNKVSELILAPLRFMM